VEGQRLVHVVGPHGFGQVPRHAPQIDLTGGEMRALHQANTVGAEGQHVEAAVAAEQRQQRLEVEAAVGDQQFLERQRQPVQALEVRCQEGRQPVALVLPEGAVLQQVAARRE
jgi:hypothetical protein